MWEKNLNQRLLLIGGVILAATFFLFDFSEWPPKMIFKKGIDIAGGVSMIFEIRQEEGENDPFLAERLKNSLARRADPNGVHNLVWRVQGHDRIEVQMPLPDKDAAATRKAYVDAFEALRAANIRRGNLERGLRTPAETRTAALAALAGDSAERKRLMEEAAARHDEYRAALERPEPDTPASRPAAASAPVTTSATTAASAKAPATPEDDIDPLLRAEEALDDAIDAVLATNFPEQRLEEILDLGLGSKARKRGIAHLKEKYEGLANQIEDVVQKHIAWRSKPGQLNGPADLKRLLKGAGILEFRILAEPNPDNRTQFDIFRQQLQERGPQKFGRFGWFKIDNPIAFFNLDSPQQLDTLDVRSLPAMVVDKYGDHFYVLSKLPVNEEKHGLLRPAVMEGRVWKLERAFVDRDENGRPCVIFRLDVVGGTLFRDLTGKNKNKQLCILVDDVAYSAANIQETIGSNGRITGDFSRDKVAYLVQTMEEGSLPGRLKDTPLSERTIESALGEANLAKAFRAGIGGLVAVALVMMLYYLLSGLIANVALVFNIALVLAAMAMLQANFTLAGIAGLILTIGMTVDANVLILERMREEKRRGSSLRMVVKNGYDKAFSTIIDSNITTLLICVIIYYAGSEEIRGFGLTLGWGIVCSLFTSLFVTRTIFTLLIKYHVIKDIKMMTLIGVPNIDWYAKRKIFIPLSAVIIISGLAMLISRGARGALDVEFLGGSSVELETKRADFTAEDITKRLRAVATGEEGGDFEFGTPIAADARRLDQVSVDPVAGDPTLFRVHLADITNERLAALVGEPLEGQGLLVRDGIDARGEGGNIRIRVQSTVDADRLRDAIHGLAGAKGAALTAENIADSNVNAILDTGDESEAGRIWNVTTTATNMALAQYAIEAALGDELVTQRPVQFVFRGEKDRPYPITKRRLEAVVPGLPAGAGGDVTDFLDGVAIYLDNLDPPQTTKTIEERIKSMRMQPLAGGRYHRSYDFAVLGITSVGADESGEELFSSVVVASVDPERGFSVDPDGWYGQFARPKLELVTAALETEQTFRKVLQFKPQIAAQSKELAAIALVLSWAMIIAYLWIRFGRPMYGIAGVCALIHDVLIALAFIGFSTAFSGFFLIEDFKINMTVIAAFLTIIGYSINDTIVIFDRIRETRGRLGVVTPEIINRSINECMSRTILTSATTFLVLAVMYVFGGSAIRGFNYCMMIGIVTGTYSSIAVAAPMLMLRLTGRQSEAPVARATRTAPA